MGARRTAVTVILVAIVCLSLGVGVGLLIAPPRVPEVVAGGSGEALVGVSPQDYIGEATLPVQATESPAREYRSMASGVVRATSCVASHPITSGSVVMTVNETPVVALRLASPPWRDLASGIEGGDVRDLQEELARLGYEVNPDGKFGAQTVRAVKKFWAALGVEQEAFPLSQMIWLESEQAIPVSCTLAVGDTATPGGAVFATGGGLSALTVTLPEGSGPREAALYEGTTVGAIGDDGVILDPVYLAQFEQSGAYVQWKETKAGSLTVPTHLVESVRVVSVAPSSLYAVSGNTACLVDQSGAALPVTIVASQLGQTFVTSTPLPTSVMIPAPKDPPPCG